MEMMGARGKAGETGREEKGQIQILLGKQNEQTLETDCLGVGAGVGKVEKYSQIF